MELKHTKQNTLWLHWRVLLVPLWNWNSGPKAEPTVAPVVLLVPLWNWNNTASRLSSSSELFYSYLYGIETYLDKLRVGAKEVLLVPLWNWNLLFLFVFVTGGKVLLVPLWNWNVMIIIVLNLTILFYSYLYGIETQQQLRRLLCQNVLLVPLWNWNRCEVHTR